MQEAARQLSYRELINMSKVKIEAEIVEPEIVVNGLVVSWKKICDIEAYEEVEKKEDETNEERDKCS